MPRKPFGTDSLRSDGSSTGPNRHVSFNNEARRFGSGLDLSGSYPEEHGGNVRTAYKGLHRLREDDEGSDRDFYPRESTRRTANEIPRHYAVENRTLERNVPQPKNYESDSLPRFSRNKTVNERITGQTHYEREDGYRDSVPYKINDFMDDSESDTEKDHHQSFDSWERKRRDEFSRNHDSGSESDPEYRYHSSQSPTRKPTLTRGNVSMLAQQLIEETKQRQQARQLFSERSTNLSFDAAQNRPFSYMDGSPTRSPTYKPGTSPVRRFPEEDDLKHVRIEETARREINASQRNKNSRGMSYDSEDNSPREVVDRKHSPVRHFLEDEDLKHARVDETTLRRENNTASQWNKKSHGISYDLEDNLPRVGGRKRSEDEEKPEKTLFSTQISSRKLQEVFEAEPSAKPGTGKRLATYVFGQEGNGDMFTNNRRDQYDRDKEIRSQDYKSRVGTYSYNSELPSRPVEIPKSSYGTQTIVYNNLESPKKHEDAVFRASYRRNSPPFEHRGYSENLTKDSRQIRQPSPIRRELSPEIPASYWKSNHEINVLKDRKVKDYPREQEDTELLAKDRYRHDSPPRTGFVARSTDLYERNSSSPERQTLPSKRLPVHGALFDEEPRNTSYRSSRRSDFEQFQRRINNDRQVPRMGTGLTKDFSLSMHNETDKVPKPPLRLKKLTGHQSRDKLDNSTGTGTNFANKPVYIHNPTHSEVPAEEFRGVRNLVGKIQSQDNFRVRTNRNLATEKYQDHPEFLDKRRSSSSSSERSSPSPTRPTVKKTAKSFPKFKKYKAPEPPSPKQEDEEVKPYIRTTKTDRYYTARHSPERQPSPEEYSLRRRKLNEVEEEYADETLVPPLSKHKLYQKTSDEQSGSTTTGRIGSSSVRFADNFASHKSRKDYGSKPNLVKNYGDLESRTGVVYQNNELESGDSDKDSKIQRQRKNFLSVFLGGDRRFSSNKKSGNAKQSNSKPDNRNKSILVREEDSYKGSLKNDKSRDRKIAKQKRNPKEEIEVGRSIVKSRSTQNLHEYETSLKTSGDGSKDYAASPYIDEPDNSSYFKVQANDSTALPGKDNPKFSSSFSLKRSDTLKKNFQKISNTEREGQFTKKSSYSPPDGYYTTQYSRSGRTVEENRGHKSASHGPPGEFDDDSTLYYNSGYANRKKEPSPTRYFGDTDTERHSKDSSGGGCSPRHAYVSGSKRLGRSTSYIGDSRGGDKTDRNLNPRRAGGLGQNNFLSSSESELSSKVSNQISGASGDSRRSTVYVHASTIAKIPKYHSAEPKANINDVENQSHLTSTEGSIDRFPSTTQRGANFQRSKRISRSFSVLAPWKPRHYKENYEITYNNNQPVKPVPGTGKPPRPPHKRREVQNDKQPINTEITPNSKPDNLTTLPKNANQEKDKNKNKNAVSRSSTMPKDSRMAGWFRKIRK